MFRFQETYKIKLERLELDFSQSRFKYDFSGQPIPRVEYLPEEVSTWGEVFKRVVELLPGKL